MGKKNKKDEVEDISDYDSVGSVDDEPEYGEPLKYDPSFKGPITNRSCTDVICCLIFVAFCLGLGFIAYYAYTNGDLEKFVYKTDSLGRICHVDVEEKRYLFYFDFRKCTSNDTWTGYERKCDTPQVCIEECPTENFNGNDEQAMYLTNPSNVRWDKFICKYNVNPASSGKEPMELFEDEDCASYYVESSKLNGRCIPDFILDGSSVPEDMVNATLPNNQTLTEDDLDAIDSVIAFGNEIVSDLEDSWWIILLGLALAAIVAFLVIILMRWLAKIMIWIIIFGVLILLALCTSYCFVNYFNLIDAEENGQITDYETYDTMLGVWLGFGIVLGIIFLIFFLLILFLRKRIQLAIELIAEASRAIGYMVYTLFWPLTPFVLQLGVLALWGTVAIFLATISTPIYYVGEAEPGFNITNGTECIPEDFYPLYSNISNATCVWGGSYYWEWTIWTYQFYNLFAMFWFLNFVIAFGEMSLAGAFAGYYWAFTKPDDIPSIPLIRSVWRSLRYHLGSLAFGSFLIALLQFIRSLLQGLEKKFKAAENPVSKFFFKCLKCCFWCLEKFLKWLNRNAYIEIAVYGKNFCSSAKTVFFLLMRNIVRAAVLDGVTSFLLFLAKISVVLIVILPAFYFINGQVTITEDVVIMPDLNYAWVPFLLIVIGAYVIASAFFGVYDMAVDTLFICFLEDCERHDGSPEKPYYMSRELMSICGKNNKEMEKAQKEAEKAFDTEIVQTIKVYNCKALWVEVLKKEWGLYRGTF
ncbi:choline transporter-like protein 2 [Glandiceps talaboti]